tara:strand:- start:211 stop:756 length:546 start_codon:yes stop_codon:yes gene_type:complete
MKSDDFKSKIEDVSLIISDVDGVLTDGSIFVSADGSEFKQFSVEDGAGAAFARYANIDIALISGRYSAATELRAEELKIKHCFQGKLNKIEAYDELCAMYKITPKNIAYIGDGLIDLPVMEKSSISFAPPNSHSLVKEVADVITIKSGGQGVLREVVEYILNEKGIYNQILETMRKEIYKG